MKRHEKEFGVYHWDTFDNETFLQYESDDREDCEKWVKDYYGNRLKYNGADQVDLVDKLGVVLESWKVC